MKRFIFLAILCSLALGMGAQTAKEEILQMCIVRRLITMPIPFRLWNRQLLLPVTNLFI